MGKISCSLTVYFEEPFWVGVFDLVFTKDEQAVAMMVIKYVENGELEGRSDEELTALMENI